MANYPTSNPSFGTKNTGDTIQASHINAVQDEVVAIGTALRTGLAHALVVSTGGLTVSTGDTILGQSLSVAGGSTLATLQVTGNSTFAGSVTFSGTIVGLPLNPPRVRCSLSTHAVSTAWTGVNWDSNLYDSHGMHSTGVNSSRLTCAGSSGIYHFGASFNVLGASTGVVRVRLLANDSTTAVIAGGMATPTNDQELLVTISGDYRMASTAEYITAQVRSGASTLSLTNAANGVTAIWSHQVST